MTIEELAQYVVKISENLNKLTEIVTMQQKEIDRMTAHLLSGARTTNENIKHIRLMIRNAVDYTGMVEDRLERVEEDIK